MKVILIILQIIYFKSKQKFVLFKLYCIYFKISYPVLNKYCSFFVKYLTIFFSIITLILKIFQEIRRIIIFVLLQWYIVIIFFFPVKFTLLNSTETFLDKIFIVMLLMLLSYFELKRNTSIKDLFIKIPFSLINSMLFFRFINLCLFDSSTLISSACIINPLFGLY